MKNPITIKTNIQASIDKVWDYWTKPQHINLWAHASDDWEARDAENDLQAGGKFKTTMAAKDGSACFDFSGSYTQIVDHKLIEYALDDGRRVSVKFNATTDEVQIEQTFEPEEDNSPDFQQQGWQVILDNFKHYTEQH